MCYLGLSFAASIIVHVMFLTEIGEIISEGEGDEKEVNKLTAVKSYLIGS